MPAPSNHATAHQRRLRTTVQRLVIELGYLEHCLATGLQDANVCAAAAGMDSAITCLNEYLASDRAAHCA